MTSDQSTTEATTESIEDRFDDSVEFRREPFYGFDEFRGYTEQKRQLRQLVVDPAEYDRFNTESVLLFGESWESQTTQLAKGLSGELGPEFSVLYLDSVASLFDLDSTNVGAALEVARKREPCLVILDCLDEMGFDETEYQALREHLRGARANNEQLLVVGITSSEDADLSRNQSLFEVVIQVSEPTENHRRLMIESELETAIDEGVISTEFDSLDSLALRSLPIEALQTAVKRAVQQCRRDTESGLPVTVSFSDIQLAIDAVDDERFEKDTSGIMFGGSTEPAEAYDPDIPDVTFDDIGGLGEEKRRLREAVTIPVQYSEVFERAGYSVGQGILLHGPPGNGKTMLAKAVANELDYHFFSVKGPELEQPFVGESERKLRELFELAREHSPTVIFFDEFDSLAPTRTPGSPEYKNDFVNALLSELDGLEPLSDIITIAATNRIDQLDDAVVRSGRFDTSIKIPQPDATARREIFEINAEGLPMADDVTSEWFSSLPFSDLSGADIATICRKALEISTAEHDRNGSAQLVVTRSHLLTAITHVCGTEQDDQPQHGYQ